MSIYPRQQYWGNIAALLTDRTLATAPRSYDSGQGAICRQGYEELDQFKRWLQRLLGPSILLGLRVRGCSRCMCCCWRVRRRCVGERVDNHNPDQSSRQFVRWEMTASGVQPLVIDRKRHRVIIDPWPTWFINWIMRVIILITIIYPQ